MKLENLFFKKNLTYIFIKFYFFSFRIDCFQSFFNQFIYAHGHYSSCTIPQEQQKNPKPRITLHDSGFFNTAF